MPRACVAVDYAARCRLSLSASAAPHGAAARTAVASPHAESRRLEPHEPDPRGPCRCLCELRATAACALSLGPPMPPASLCMTTGAGTRVSDRPGAEPQDADPRSGRPSPEATTRFSPVPGTTTSRHPYACAATVIRTEHVPAAGWRRLRRPCPCSCALTVARLHRTATDSASGTGAPAVTAACNPEPRHSAPRRPGSRRLGARAHAAAPAVPPFSPTRARTADPALDTGRAGGQAGRRWPLVAGCWPPVIGLIRPTIATVGK